VVITVFCVEKNIFRQIKLDVTRLFLTKGSKLTITFYWPKSFHKYQWTKAMLHSGYDMLLIKTVFPANSSNCTEPVTGWVPTEVPVHVYSAVLGHHEAASFALQAAREHQPTPLLDAVEPSQVLVAASQTLCNAVILIPHNWQLRQFSIYVFKLHIFFIFCPPFTGYSVFYEVFSRNNLLCVEWTWTPIN